MTSMFRRFVKDVFEHWKALMSGGLVIIVLGIFERLSGKTVSLSVYLAIASLSVLYACYRAWLTKAQKLTNLIIFRFHPNSAVRVSQRSDASDDDCHLTVGIMGTFENADLHPDTVRDLDVTLWRKRRMLPRRKVSLHLVKLIAERASDGRQINLSHGISLEVGRTSEKYNFYPIYAFLDGEESRLGPNHYLEITWRGVRQSSTPIKVWPNWSRAMREIDHPFFPIASWLPLVESESQPQQKERSLSDDETADMVRIWSARSKSRLGLQPPSRRIKLTTPSKTGSDKPSPLVLGDYGGVKFDNDGVSARPVSPEFEDAIKEQFPNVTITEFETNEKEVGLMWVRSKLNRDGKPKNGDGIVLLETDSRHPTPDGQVHVAGDMKVQVFPTLLVLEKLRKEEIEECDPPRPGDTVLGGNPLHVGGNPNQPLRKN
jgi:hypothetical protein